MIFGLVVAWYLGVGAVFAIVLTVVALHAEQQGTAEGTELMRQNPALWFVLLTVGWVWFLVRTEIEVSLKLNRDRPKKSDQDEGS